MPARTILFLALTLAACGGAAPTTTSSSTTAGDVTPHPTTSREVHARSERNEEAPSRPACEPEDLDCDGYITMEELSRHAGAADE